MFNRFRSRASIGATCVVALVLFHPQVARADAVLDWNRVLLATLVGQPPFPAARYAAITQLAVFEAVNAITGEYHPYVHPLAAPAGASVDAAVAAAAHAVLTAYFPAKTAALDAALAATLATIPDDRPRAMASPLGEAAAAVMLALRANDGSAVPQFYFPGVQRPRRMAADTVLSTVGGAFLHWRNVIPFGVPAVDRFMPAPPPPLTSGTYRRDYDEVKRVGGMNSGDRPADRPMSPRSTPASRR